MTEPFQILNESSVAVAYAAAGDSSPEFVVDAMYSAHTVRLGAGDAPEGDIVHHLAFTIRLAELAGMMPHQVVVAANQHPGGLGGWAAERGIDVRALAAEILTSPRLAKALEAATTAGERLVATVDMLTTLNQWDGSGADSIS